MIGHSRLLVLAVLVGLTQTTAAQDAGPPPAPLAPRSRDPVLRLEAGPLGPITAVAFGADGSTLYETGWDKVVRVWKRDRATGAFALSTSLRIPIGPGDAGVMNALAVSSDGTRLAVGGNA